MQTLTNFKLTDNSGVKTIKSIKFYKKTPKSQIHISNKFIGAVHQIKFKKKSKLKKINNGDLKTAIVLRTKTPIKRYDGSMIKFFENSALLIDTKNKPLATRIIGLIPLDLRRFKKMKFILVSSYITL